MFEVLNKISDIGIVPVIAIKNADDAVPLAKALIKGGLPCAEVTFRTAAAEQAIKNISKECPEMLVGAGTVLTKEQADTAMAAGAKFLVSPGLNPEVVKYCIDKGYPMTPGIANPSDIEQALSLGLDAVKFFPAEAAGGLPMIKAMSAPYGNLKFMPTGGINAKNLKSYLDFNKIFACGGSWMVNNDLIEAKNWGEIERLTREAVKEMLGFKIIHIGINSENEKEAQNLAKMFSLIFGFENVDGSQSIFSSDEIEIMKFNGYGSKGHLAVKTNYMNRAVRYLSSLGVEFDKESEKYDDNGNLKLVYLKDDFGGFRIHLVQK